MHQSRFLVRGGAVQEPAFYAYAAPEPPGCSEADVLPAECTYRFDLKEFVLPYEAVRLADDPEKTLLDFMQSTYEAGANTGKWKRDELER